MPLITVFIAVVLVASAIGKLTSSEALVSYLAALRISRHIAGRLTAGVSLVELIIGVALLAGIAVRWVTAAAAGVTILFVVTHVVAMLSGTQEPCRCFGAVDSELQPALGLARAALLAAATILVAAWDWTGGHAPPHYGVYAVLSGTLASFTYVLVFPLAGEATKMFRRAHELRLGLLALARERDSRTG